MLTTADCFSIINNLSSSVLSPVSSSPPLLLMKIMMESVDCGRSSELYVFSFQPSWFIKQLLFHPLLLQSGPAGASGSPTGWELWRRTSSPGGDELRFTPPPLLQLSSDQTGSSVPYLHLIVSVSGRESTTWWRVTFGRSDAGSPLSLLNRGWKLGNRRGVQMSVVRRDTKRGAHNGFGLGFSGSV